MPVSENAYAVQLSSTNEARTNDPAEDDSDSDKGPSIADESDDDWQDTVTHYPDVRRSIRDSKPPERFGFEAALFVQEALLQNEASSTPLTYREAIDAPESNAWKFAMDEEIEQINNKGTWSLVELPSGYKNVKCKWVYAAKLNADNQITRHRARLVAKGFTQQKGINYDEMFSPVVKYSTIRLVLAIAAPQKLEMILLDVKTAFLNGELDETIYMEQPEGYVITGKEHFVYRLKKALYGLKQASRAWHKVIKDFLLDLGCKRSCADASLYLLKVESQMVFILVYVDDILLVSRNMSVLEGVSRTIADRFEVRVEQSVRKFLGMIIEQEPMKKSIKLHSSTMIDQMLCKFGMESCNPVAIPLQQGVTLSVSMGPVDEEEKQLMRLTPYRQLIGCILHLSNTTRPDIAFAAGYLSIFMQNPGHAHWKAAKHVLRYLKGTRTRGILYCNDKCSMKIQAYSDSDFAGDLDGRRSTSGHCFLLNGGCISWRSKKQTLVAQSTVEAEYIAISFAVREALWIQKILVDMGIEATTLKVGGDNQGAICLSHDELENERSKHIDVKYHFTRDHIKRGTIKLEHVPTCDMVADIMTKALGRQKHEKFSKLLGMKTNFFMKQPIRNYVFGRNG